jgi:hypothetical protein
MTGYPLNACEGLKIKDEGDFSNTVKECTPQVAHRLVSQLETTLR